MVQSTTFKYQVYFFFLTYHTSVSTLLPVTNIPKPTKNDIFSDKQPSQSNPVRYIRALYPELLLPKFKPDTLTTSD